jgi:AcrR family transcriptional regulator
MSAYLVEPAPALERQGDGEDRQRQHYETEGLHRASLRAVADEAQLNIGSLRHYFASQQDLMRFAMQSMLDRVGSRLLEHVERIGDRRSPGRRRGIRHPW